MNENTVILIDMDGVLADFNSTVLNIFKQRYPKLSNIVPAYEARTEFYIANNFPQEHRNKIHEITKEPGLFAKFNIVDKAKEGIEYLNSKYKVFICTKPLSTNPTCMNDKYSWLIKHLGEKWRHQITLATDKTIVRGDYLIDDRPDIPGALNPTWEHILYDRTYNRHITGKKRVNWETIKEFF